MVVLDIYIADDCWSKTETERLANMVIHEFPAVSVRLISADSGPWPNFVFAAPTYVLNGRVISLGNPGWPKLCNHLETAVNNFQKHEQARYAKPTTNPTIQG